MPRPTHFFLSAALAILPIKAIAGFSDEQPLLPPSSLAPVSTVFQRQYFEYRAAFNQQVPGGIALATDAVGNIYMASGAPVSKYSAAGTKLWEHTHESVVQNVLVDGQSQSRYYETWDQNQTELIPQGSSLDAGERVSPYAQRVLVDTQGNVYANFLDTSHTDRSLVVKFSTDGTLIWRQVTEYPYTTESGFPWESRVKNMVLLPDHPA